MSNHSRSLSADVQLLPWVAQQLGISKATAYRLAKVGKIPGCFKVGAQYRVSVPAFWLAIHGDEGAQLQANAWHAYAAS
jgi:excisionase family DNA binding protein